jgi:hypothetical protein
VAEREGFEPPVGLPPQRFSKPSHSTTLPSLRSLNSSIARDASGLHQRNLAGQGLDGDLNAFDAQQEGLFAYRIAKPDETRSSKGFSRNGGYEVLL